ncbi:MAG: hypothetical protein KJ550_08145 [Proteobacteria bacterium]|nr:hypothetical protein [Desulfobacteraceae bacterium]MBU4013422.1 hypothetical protein [Pseudomonadota bacterium]MBU4068566.1 hypothetical protein [Pseudomonadota bacterium]MBU4127203.1 hypothetical protein [Pseudomonadota bacterium]
MPNKWIHINTEVADPWILPIWSAVNNLESAGKSFPISKEVKSQLGLSISTRLDMLPRIVYRINSEVNEVYKTTKAHNKENIFTDQREGYAFDIEENLKFNLLIDIDSLLFELNSVCELMTRLFFVLYSHIGKNIKKKEVGLIIKKIIEGAGKSSEWFVVLDNQRNFFMHEGAPYFAVDVTEGPGVDSGLNLPPIPVQTCH